MRRSHCAKQHEGSSGAVHTLPWPVSVELHRAPLLMETQQANSGRSLNNSLLHMIWLGWVKMSQSSAVA